MKHSIVVVGWGIMFLALAGCSSDPAPAGTSTGSGPGGGGAKGGSAGQAGDQPGQGGGGAKGGSAGQAGGRSGQGGDQVTRDASSTDHDGASVDERTDASTTAADASNDVDLDGGGWKILFNGKDLTGWTPSPGAAAFFAAGLLDGEGVIHVYPTQPDQSDQPQATLRTTESYGSYVFHEEYKWGTNRFGSRKQTDRDNGICFHVCNDPTQVWPESIEFQIGSQAWPGDWVVGNIFMLVNKTRAQWPFVMMNGQQVFSENGTRKSIGAPASYEKALAPVQLNSNTDWNILELTVHGSKDAEYKVNGTVVNRVFSMECNEGGSWKPLDHGPIALQAEFAEVYFRNVRIKELP
jgi:hypothetical protein